MSQECADNCRNKDSAYNPKAILFDLSADHSGLWRRFAVTTRVDTLTAPSANRLGKSRAQCHSGTIGSYS